MFGDVLEGGYNGPQCFCDLSSGCEDADNGCSDFQRHCDLCSVVCVAEVVRLLHFVFMVSSPDLATTIVPLDRAELQAIPIDRKVLGEPQMWYLHYRDLSRGYCIV
jgi:hypothetical protein